MIVFNKKCIVKNPPNDINLCEFEIRKQFPKLKKIVHTEFNHLVFFANELSENCLYYKEPQVYELIKFLNEGNRTRAIVVLNNIEPNQLIY